MFQTIPSDKLVIGNKYGIVCQGDDYSGTYRGPAMGCGKQFIVFDKVRSVNLIIRRLIGDDHFEW